MRRDLIKLISDNAFLEVECCLIDASRERKAGGAIEESGVYI
jgi:hypothetical protein